MPAPTSLGLVATGDAYVPWGHASSGGSPTSPLELTTLVDIPAATPRHSVYLLVLLRYAPSINEVGTGNGLTIDSITDDAPGPGDANVYTTAGLGGNGSFAYNFGRPTFQCFAAFDIGNNGSGVDKSGGSNCAMVYCRPSRPIPVGSTISIAFTPALMATALIGATALAFVDGGIPGVQLSSRTINPAITADGDSANVPLGDHILSELVGLSDYIVAHVWADDAKTVDNTIQITGSETIDDVGAGVWTKLDAGGRATTSDQGGLVFSVFTADASLVDLSQPLVSFEISDGIGVDDGIGDNATPGAGVVMYRTQYAVRPPEGSPSFSRVIPV